MTAGVKLNYTEQRQSRASVGGSQVLEPRSSRFKVANKFLVSIPQRNMMEIKSD